MNMSNGDRILHGISAHSGMEGILNWCLQAGYIADYFKNYRIGKDGYTNDLQFYAPFLIRFNNGKHWALFTTTSMRSDRVKGQQWDALNLKAINDTIEKVVLVYPDEISDRERALFIRQNEKYQTSFEYSEIDEIVSQGEVSNLIEAYALCDYSGGRLKDKQGNEFEKKVVSALTFPDNLAKWKTNSPIITGMHYDMFLEIVTAFNLNPENVTEIEATCDKRDIGLLPSGGNPKTDVMVIVSFDDGQSLLYTISCKRTSMKSVSVHQYNADAFSDVLNPEDERLRTLLNGFQSAGSMTAFGEENCAALEDALIPYHEKLSLWVLGGFGGEGSQQQCASFILTYSNKTGAFAMHDIFEYYQELVSAGVSGSFGTIFSWTYPSGRRGRDIQLKCRIL